jgi:hypothetical protein
MNGGEGVVAICIRLTEILPNVAWRTAPSEPSP